MDGLLLLTPPSGEPISLTEAKGWLRVDLDDDGQDDEIRAVLAAARKHCETATGRQLVSAQYRLVMSGFCEEIRAPRAPLAAVSSVAYYDANNALQTLSASTYEVDLSRPPGRISLAWNRVWPSTYSRRDAVRVDCWVGHGPNTHTTSGFEAGTQTVTPHSMEAIVAGQPLVVGEGAERETIVVSSVSATAFTAAFRRGHSDPCPILPALPNDVLMAMRLLIAHWWRNREAVATGMSATEIPLGVQALLDSAWTGGYR